MSGDEGRHRPVEVRQREGRVVAAGRPASSRATDTSGPWKYTTCNSGLDADREVIVGATLVGAGVGELIHAATVAIVDDVPLDRLRHAVSELPTLSEVWLRLLERVRSGASDLEEVPAVDEALVHACT